MHHGARKAAHSEAWLLLWSTTRRLVHLRPSEAQLLRAPQPCLKHWPSTLAG